MTTEPMPEHIQDAHDTHMRETMIREAKEWDTCYRHKGREPEDCVNCARDVLDSEVRRLTALTAERDSLRLALDEAVKALKYYEQNACQCWPPAHDSKCLSNKSIDALAKIAKLRGEKS